MIGETLKNSIRVTFKWRKSLFQFVTVCNPLYGSRLWNSNLWFLVIHYMRTDCRTSILIVHWMEAGNIITYSYPILVVHYMGSFRSNSTFSFGWSQSSLLWSLGLLDSPAVTVCLWTIEIRRTRPFQLSSVSQQLATCVKSFFCLLMGILIFSSLKDQFTGRHIIDSLLFWYFDIIFSFYCKTHHGCIIPSLFWYFPRWKTSLPEDTL